MQGALRSIVSFFEMTGWENSDGAVTNLTERRQSSEIRPTSFPRNLEKNRTTNKYSEEVLVLTQHTEP
jgi:hypothetical protein